MATLHTHRLKVIASTVAVLLWAGVTTADPQTIDNAALLYYQACLLYSQPDGTLEQSFNDFRSGLIPSTEPIRKHIESSRRVIEFVVKAADLPHCDWGHDYSQGLDLSLTHLAALRRIGFLLAADARLSAEQGDYQTALDRCMTLHNMALHETDRMAVTYLVGIALSGLANKTIQDLLVSVSSETEPLNHLKIQLSQIQDAFPSIQYAITQEGQVLAASIRREKAEDTVRDMALDSKDPNTGVAAARILAGDEAFFERNRAHWSNAIASIVTVLDSELPYPQMRTRLDDLGAQLTGNSKNDPDATFTGVLLPAVSRIYLLATRLQGHFNVLRVATDIYAIHARTGRLPDVLPADAPGDPFSGKAFLYERADDHFTLRCSEKEEPEKPEANKYEFKIRQ